MHFFDLYAHWFGPGRAMRAHAETRPLTDQQDRVICLVRHDTGMLANHYHGFDQVAPMDRTSHRIVCQLGDIRVDGWIPLSLTVDAAVDEARLAALAAAIPDAQGQTITLCILQAAGEVNLNDRVQKWMPGFRLRDTLATHEINIVDLLSHRLGFEYSFYERGQIGVPLWWAVNTINSQKGVLGKTLIVHYFDTQSDSDIAAHWAAVACNDTSMFVVVGSNGARVRLAMKPV